MRVLLAKLISHLKKRELKRIALQCAVEDRSALCPFTEEELIAVLRM